MRVRFRRSDSVNGRASWAILVRQPNNRRREVGRIVWDAMGKEWCLHLKHSIRVDRFERLRDAKDEALKI